MASFQAGCSYPSSSSSTSSTSTSTSTTIRHFETDGSPKQCVCSKMPMKMCIRSVNMAEWGPMQCTVQPAGATTTTKKAMGPSVRLHLLVVVAVVVAVVVVVVSHYCFC